MVSNGNITPPGPGPLFLALEDTLVPAECQGFINPYLPPKYPPLVTELPSTMEQFGFSESPVSDPLGLRDLQYGNKGNLSIFVNQSATAEAEEMLEAQDYVSSDEYITGEEQGSQHSDDRIITVRDAHDLFYTPDFLDTHAFKITPLVLFPSKFSFRVFMP